jgi:hypothetical protein
MTINQFKKGVDVICWDKLRENPTKTTIISDPEPIDLNSPEAKTKGQEWMDLYGFECNVEGFEGKISIEQLDLITPGSLLAASLKGLSGGQEQFKKASEDFFSDNNLKVIFNIEGTNT